MHEPSSSAYLDDTPQELVRGVSSLAHRPTLQWAACEPDAVAQFPEIFEHDDVSPVTSLDDEYTVVGEVSRFSSKSTMSQDKEIKERIETKRVRVKQECVDVELSRNESSIRPLKKRPRVFLDCVEITTPSKKHRLKSEEFLHPKWKIKRYKEDEAAGFDSVFRRVEALGAEPHPIPLHSDILDFTVSREFVSTTYGGNPQETFPRIAPEKLAQHGYNEFMFLNIMYNPRAPQRPGFPGLYYEPGHGIDDLPQVHRVFIRVQDNVWLYIGQYQLLPSEPLSPQEWKQCSNATKKIWTEKICSCNWGRDIRVKIALRKQLGHEPAIREIENHLSKGKDITPEDVMKACNDGEVRLNIWVMKCVGYDEAFQREMMDKHKDWQPRPKLVRPTIKLKRRKGSRKEQSS